MTEARSTIIIPNVTCANNWVRWFAGQSGDATLERKVDLIMLRTFAELIRYDVKAVDAIIGTVEDFYFDDRTWAVRYLVVDTAGAIGHHQILIQPKDVRELEFPSETLVLHLNKNEVEACPSAKTVPPCSQQTAGNHGPKSSSANKTHLRSANALNSCGLAASDRELGDVHGIIIETATWSIRYLVVETGEWLTGKLVLLAPQAVRQIDWADKKISSDLTSEAIKGSPEYDVTGELSREYEAYLHDYYGWKPYWN